MLPDSDSLRQFDDFIIDGFSPISETRPNTLSWARDQALDWGEIKSSVIICSLNMRESQETKAILIKVVNPRLVFTEVLSHFTRAESQAGIEPTAVIGENCQIGEGVYIGHYSVIGDYVIIGDHTRILNHVVIRNAAIGRHCLIKSNTVIGEKGFGFEVIKDKPPLEMPHVGMVEIGNHVEIGALNTVVQGTLGNTIVGDYVKTDDHVHIAHNMVIEENAIITACAEFSGGVRVGKGAWIGPNVSIKEKVTIGEDSLIGIGSVVIEDVESNMVVAGSPARPLKRRFS